MQIEKRGRRHYFIGAPYEARHTLRDAGCKWDPAAKAWWTGKAETAAELGKKLGGSNAPDSRPESRDEKLTADSTVLGRARYKGREYLLVWEGTTRRGRAAKLAFRDGSKIFWADAAAVEVTKRYRATEWRGREQPMTFGRLSRLREDYAAQTAAAKDCELVGERGAYQAQFEADKRNRTPGLSLGATNWLKHRKARIAVVLVGYEPATYLRSDDAEDMGHYGVQSGWYGTAEYRVATIDEWAALQAEAPREDGACVAAAEAVVAALAVGGRSVLPAEELVALDARLERGEA